MPKQLHGAEALPARTFHPYGDFLLHDIGTGPSVLRECRCNQGQIRTAPLWGLGTRLANGEPLLHDGSARSLKRHPTTPRTPLRRKRNFRRLSERDRARMLKFLQSL